MKTRKKRTTKPTVKRKRNTKAPSAKQLAARAKFAAAAKARSKKATKKRNKTIIKKAKKVIVLNPKRRSTKNPNAISIKSTTYRGQKGFLLSGSDNRGRKVSVFAKTRAQADKLKPALKRADDAAVSSILLQGSPTPQRNKTIIKKAKKVIVLNPGKVVRRKVRNGYLNLEIKGRAEKTPDGWKLGGKTFTQGRGVVPVTKKGFYLDRATGTVFAKRTVERNPRAKRRNASPAARARREEFAGKHTGDLTLHFPQKSLSGLSTLGPLVSLQGEFGTIKPTKGGVYYCQDARGRIHIGAKSGDDLWARVKENLGAVRRVEYRAAKPHLGYPNVITWFHDFEAPYPILKSDGKGGLLQTGGGYTIKREGIVG